MLIHNADITGSLTINGVPYNSGSFSGSFRGDGSQLTGITGASTASYVEYSNVGNKPALVSGSSQITYSGLSGIPSGIVSGSSQVSFNGIVDKPTLVSGSSQVTYGGLSGIPAGIVSGSSQVTYSGLTGIPAGIVSSSAQIGGYGIFATTGSNSFNGSQTVTGSLTVTGQVVAQTLNVQQVTSSIVYSSGSNVFGNSLANTQQFTGSVSVTGSLVVAGAGTFTSSVTANGLNALGSTLNNGNALRFYRAGLVEMGYIGWSNENANNSTWLFKSSNGNPIGFSADGTNQQLFVNISGNVGIGTTDPSRLLHILAPTGNHAYGRIEGGSGGYGGFLELMANSVGSGTDSAGKVDFYMTSTNRIATIDAKRTSDGANYGTLIFSTANNATTPTERMRITTGGVIYSRLGQSGTTAREDITANLVLEGQSGIASGRAGISLLSQGAAYGIIMFGSPNSTNTDGYIQYLNDNRAMVFGTADGPRMRITSGGNVGIGTSDPGSRLHISDASGATRLVVDNTANAAAGAGVYFRTYSSSTLVSNTTLRTDNAGNFSVFNGTSSDSENMRIASNGSTTFTGPITNNHGALYSQSTLFLNKLVNVGDNTTTTVLTISQDGAYSQIGGGEILIVFVDNGSPWGVYVWKGLISVRTVQFGSMYGTGIQEISSRNNLDGSISVICTTTKTGGVADAVTRVQITTGSGIAGTAHVSFNGYIQGGSQPV